MCHPKRNVKLCTFLKKKCAGIVGRWMPNNDRERKWKKKKGATWLFAMVVIIVYRFRSGCSLFPNRYPTISSYGCQIFRQFLFFASPPDSSFILFHLKRQNRAVQLYAYSTIQMMSIYYEKPFSLFRFRFVVRWVYCFKSARLLLFNVKFIFSIHLSNSNTHIKNEKKNTEKKQTFSMRLTNDFWTEWMNIGNCRNERRRRRKRNVNFFFGK